MSRLGHCTPGDYGFGLLRNAWLFPCLNSAPIFSSRLSRYHLHPSGLFTKSFDETTAKSLGRMMYGVVCFATLFSFVGTILGGIWADQSWGRFWGWDPKENGALLIVIWNAIILHARWGGYARERGIAVLTVFGNIITSLSWFGVNMLGVGLHSYGFMDQAFGILLAFIASQLVIIGLGMVPAKYWRGIQAPEQPSIAERTEPVVARSAMAKQ